MHSLVDPAVHSWVDPAVYSLVDPAVNSLVDPAEYSWQILHCTVGRYCSIQLVNTAVYS